MSLPPKVKGGTKEAWKAVLDKYGEIDARDEWTRYPGLAALIKELDLEIYESEKYGEGWCVVAPKED